jgi:GTPase SAR1 family protein
MVGERRVGKTSFMIRFTDDVFYNPVRYGIRPEFSSKIV